MHIAKWTTCLALGSLIATGCAADSSTDQAPDTVEGDGAYRYVLGYDYASGRKIYGGTHKVVVPTERGGKAEAIDQANRASSLHPALKGEHAKYDADLTEGETDWDVFASYWWPQSKNGTAYRWQLGANQDYNSLDDKDELAPTEKYDLLANPGQSRDVAEVEHCEYRDFVDNGDDCEKIKRPAVTVAGPATKWELENQGQYQTYDPENWWGHCNGWASYATAEPLGYPQRDVRVKLDGGKIVECDTASDDCILFKMADVEALMTELYFSDQATFAGRRCNTAPDEIETDEFGRPTDVRCRDMNAGSLHIAMTGLLNKGAEHLVTKEMGKPAFVIDHNFDFEIWNFPLVSFDVRSAQEITEEKANELVGATGSDYEFNSSAVKFIEVRSTYEMISDSVPAHQLTLRADQRSIPPHPVDLNYVLELDAQGTIIGGEWIQDPQLSWGEDSKKLHPDFMWMATNPIGWGENADDTGGNSDNPFISYPIVKAILTCANDASTCATDGGGNGGGGACEGNCGSSSTEDGATCYCDELCQQYNDCCSDYVPTCTGDGGGDDGGGDDGGGDDGGDDAPTCEGHCGNTTAVEGSSPACYCDSACSGYGDCCGDFDSVCSL